MNPESQPAPEHNPTPEELELVEAMGNPAVARNPEQMEAVAARMMELAMKYAAAHPSPDEALSGEFSSHLEAGEWREALALGERLITSYRGRKDYPQLFRHHQRVSSILLVLGEPAAAREAARAATGWARQDPRIDILVAMALENEAICALAIGNPDEALRLAEEAIALFGPEALAETACAKARVLCARAYVAQGDLTRAEAELADALEPLERRAESAVMSGAQAGLANYYHTKARIHRARGERSQASKWQRFAAGRARIVAVAPQLESHVGAIVLARELRNLRDLLTEEGEDAEARTADAELQGLLARLRLPSLPYYD